MLLFGRGSFFFFSVSWHHSTLLQTHWASVSLKSCQVWFVFVYVLTACVFVTRDTVRHPRRFVFGKSVRKPNCSWSETFVNRGLIVDTLISQIYFWNKTLHVSDSSSVRHQEFFTAAQDGTVLILLASCQQACMTCTIAVCTVKNSWWWRGTVRNM